MSEIEFILNKTDATYLLERNVTISAGDKRTLADIVGKGFWGAIFIASDSPYLKIWYEIDGAIFEGTIAEIFALGLTEANNYFFYIPVYDVSNDIYCLAWAPSIPAPFSRRCKVELRNETASAITCSIIEAVFGVVYRE